LPERGWRIIRHSQRQRGGREVRPSDILGGRLRGRQEHERSLGCACGAHGNISACFDQDRDAPSALYTHPVWWVWGFPLYKGFFLI
jgi:hypothetical protein